MRIGWNTGAGKSCGIRSWTKLQQFVLTYRSYVLTSFIVNNLFQFVLPILPSHDPPTNHQKSIYLAIKHPLQPSLPGHLIPFKAQFYYTRNFSATCRSPSNFYFLNILTLSVLNVLLNAAIYFTLQSLLRDLYTVRSLAAEATTHVTFTVSVVLWLHFVILNAGRGQALTSIYPESTCIFGAIEKVQKSVLHLTSVIFS